MSIIELENISLKFVNDIVDALNDVKIRKNLRDLPYPYIEDHGPPIIFLKIPI